MVFGLVRVIKKPGGAVEQRQTLHILRMSIIRGVNLSMVATYRYNDVLDLRVDFSGKVWSMLMDDHSRNSPVCKKQKMKAKRKVNMVFPIIETKIDRETGFQNDLNITDVQCMYSGVVFKVLA